MPEGPTILLLKEAMEAFTGKKVLAASGNAKIDLPILVNKKILSFRTWGKQLLIGFRGFTIRIHLLMYGSCRINERKDAVPRLSLIFSQGELNFYSCSVRLLEGSIRDEYDWRVDVLSDKWDPAKARAALRERPEWEVADALLEQEIFAGVGNIIKNEVLFRIRVHPQSLVGKLPPSSLRALVREARRYSLQFLEWKRIFELKKHWKIYHRPICPRCHLKVTRRHTGVKNRFSFFCPNCQILYS